MRMRKPGKGGIAATALWLAGVLSGFAQTGVQEEAAAAVPIGVVQVIQARLPIPIENANRSFRVGDHLQLFQENDEFFIALWERPYGARQLVAVPLRKGSGKVAWVTPEHVMFFGTEIGTMDGRLYLRSGEELAVIRESRGKYEALVERLGQQASIWISKADPGIRFIPNPILTDGRIVPPAPPAKDSRADAKAAVEEEQGGAARVLRRALRAHTEPAEVAKPIEHLFPDMDDALISFMMPDTAGLEWDTVEEDRSGLPMNERIELLLDDMLASLQVRVRLVAIVVLSFLLIIVVLVMGLRRSVLKHAHQPSVRTLPSPGEAKRAAAEASPPQEPEKQGLAADFSGSVASMSLGSVTQFLNSDKETGILTVSENDHKRLGTMVFVEGEIVDAATSNKRGVPAVYDLLKCREGLFSFVRQAQSGVSRTVEQGTISLLLDAHRELDEQGHPEEEEKKERAPAHKHGKKEKASPLRIKRHASH